MSSSFWPRRRDLARGFGLAFVLLTTGLAEAQSTPRPGNNADRAKAPKPKGDRARANPDRRRAEPAKGASAAPEKARSESRGKADEPRREPADGDPIPPDRVLSYRFTPGQTLGYYIETRTEFPERVERYVGTPVFAVRSVDARKDEVEFSGTGRVGCYKTPGGVGEETARPSLDYWNAATLRFDLPHARRMSGRDPSRDGIMHHILRLFEGPERLIFLELPSAAPGKLDWSRPATFRIDPKYAHLVKDIQGRETCTVRAEAVSPALARILRRRTFARKGEWDLELRYDSTTLFDRTRGLVLSTDGTLRETWGEDRSTTTVTVRLLEGDELKQAIARAEDDRRESPGTPDATEDTSDR